ncbi:MAG: restriction endonuclease subunit S, partial [Sulfuricurvum sp.]
TAGVNPTGGNTQRQCRRAFEKDGVNVVSGVVEQQIPEGYKQTEVGTVPTDWEILPLSNLTVLMTNGFVGTAKTHYTDSHEGVLYVQGYNVEENSFNFRGIKKVTPEFHKRQSKSCLREGDVLMVQTGDVGLTTIVPKELAGANCHALIILRFKLQTLDPQYFSYYLNSKDGRNRLKDLEVGTTMKHINVGNLLHFPVPVPSSKTEQTAIANALSDVDALITSLEKLIAKKRAIKTATMQQLLTGKKRLPPFHLTHTGYKQTELGEIPEDWDIYALGEIFRVTAGGDLRKTEFSDTKTQEYSCPIYSNALTNSGLYGFCLTHDYDGNYITVTARGSIGHAEERNGKFCAIGRLLVLKPINELSCKFVAEFVNQYLSFANESTGVPQLTAPQVSQYEVVLPLKQEQAAIANVLHDMDKEIEALEQRLNKTQQLKQGMMQELLTGRTRLI